MGDMGEMWRDVKDARKSKKQSNLERSTELLVANEIPFESKNGGAHLIVTATDGLIDFWPSTGLWSERQNKQRNSRGVARLLHYLDQKDRVHQTQLINNLLKH